MNKKRVIFAVTIFVALGLFLFTFANPRDNDEATNNDIVKPTTNDVKPVVEEPKEEEKENEEPAVTTILEAPRNNQANAFNNNVVAPTNNVPRMENNDPTPEERKEAPVVEPVKVYHKVQFIGFNNEIVDVQDVEDGKDAVAPTVTDVTKNGVVYTFNGWDNEYTNIKANTTVKAIYEITKITATIVLDGEEYGTIDLKVSESLFDAITNPAVVTTDQTEIEGLVDGTLPTTEVLNHKYSYTSLEYVADKGFVITGSLVIDEEALARNTVVLTYIIDDNAFFFGGTKKITTKTTNGYNKVVLPKVFVGFNEANVIWTDANGELKEGYTSSMTLTAKLDKQGPVITLKGLTERELFATNGSYREEGFTVTDNYTRLTERNVVVTIKLGNQLVDKVDYSKPGTYTITYTAVDTEGNVGTAKRVITVKKVELVSLELSKTTGSYLVGDSMENITVTAVYNNGTRKVLNKQTCRYYSCTDGYTQDKNFDSTTKGTKSITYSYTDNNVTKKATYNYTVDKIELESLELSKTSGTYYVGDSMETITVTAVYTDGTRKVLSKQTCNYGRCSDGYTQDKEFNSATKGTKSIKYSYTDDKVTKTATYNYTVNKIELESLELSKTSGTYFVGDSMENITVTAVYTDGSRKVLNKQTCRYYSCTDGYTQDKEFNSSSKGNRTITYSYKDDEITKTATYSYEVKEAVVTGIELSSYYGSYIVGDEMEQLDVYVVYSNGRKEKVDHYSVQGFNTNKNNVGNGHVITVNYKGMKANYTYDVKYHAEIGREQIAFFLLSDYYLEFDIPKTTYVSKIVAYDANGVAHNVQIPSGSTTKIMISKENYDIIHSMTGNNSNQKLVVTYNVKGEEIESTYTRVVTK